MLENTATVEEKLNWRQPAAADRLARILFDRSADQSNVEEAERLWRECVGLDIDRDVTASAAAGLASIYLSRGLNDEAARWSKLSRLKQSSLYSVPATQSEELLPRLQHLTKRVDEQVEWDGGRLVLSAAAETQEVRLVPNPADHYRH